MWIFTQTEVSSFYTLLQLSHVPRILGHPVQPVGPGVSCQGSDRDTSREPESEKHPLSSQLGGKVSRRKGTGREGKNVDSRCKGAGPAEVRVIPRE